jgi:ADP-heptose:LPS heptosyltransferase
MRKIVVFRFSAMGDAALLLPVLRGVLHANTDTTIYIATRKQFAQMFENIDRLIVIQADFNGRHKGLWGLVKLFKDIRKTAKPDLVIDLHKVIRSVFLTTCFTLYGHPSTSYSKGRRERKKALKTKDFSQVTHTVQNYANAFKKHGIGISSLLPPYFEIADRPIQNAKIFLENNNVNGHKIGIAPFAKHDQKIWGIERVYQLIEMLNKHIECTFFLFGGGKKEEAELKQLGKNFSNCIVVAGQLELATELALISHLDMMISMDSANMHLASVSGTPTFSIWGATHPSMGFSPFLQPDDQNIQYLGQNLTCRPCSVYGNKKCMFESLRCMEYISVNEVANKVIHFLEPK